MLWRDLRVIWEVAKLQTLPWRRMVAQIIAGLKLLISAPASLEGIAFRLRRLWRHSATSADRWYRCQGCGRLWHVDFGGGYGWLADDGDSRRTQGYCRWCSQKRNTVSPLPLRWLRDLARRRRDAEGNVIE